MYPVIGLIMYVHSLGASIENMLLLGKCANKDNLILCCVPADRNVLRLSN